MQINNWINTVLRKNKTMKKNNLNVIGCVPISYTQITIIDNFLNVHGWSRLYLNNIIYDAVPTHLVLYENNLFDFVFYPDTANITPNMTLEAFKTFIKTQTNSNEQN